MSPTSSLPGHVASKIVAFGETSYGAYMVALVMSDGTVVEDVIVSWGRDVVSIAGVDVTDFDGSSVVDALDRRPGVEGA